MRGGTIVIAAVLVGTSACRRSESPEPRVDPLRDDEAGVAPLPAVFERAPLTVVTRIAELCEPAAMVELVGMLSRRPKDEGAGLSAAIEPPASAGPCAIVLAPNLVDYVAVIPGARLSSAPQQEPAERITARASGDAVVVGPARALDEIAMLPPIVEWAAMAEVEAARPDAWAIGVLRFDVASPIAGHAFEPKIRDVTFHIEEQRVVAVPRGDDEILALLERELRGELERVQGLGTLARLQALVEADAAAGVAIPFGLADAFAKGRVHFELSPGALEIRVDIERADETKAALLLGIVSAIAGPAISKYHRRNQTAEPRVNLARMFDGIVDAMYEDPKRPSTFIGCPIADGPIGWTPRLDVPCAQGPGGRCTIGGDGPAAYSRTKWAAKGWNEVGFSMSEAHRFHYNFRASTTPGYRGCQFTAQAFGDLDGDGLFSTFERAGAADHLGVNAPGLYIDNEVE